MKTQGFTVGQRVMYTAKGGEIRDGIILTLGFFKHLVFDSGTHRQRWMWGSDLIPAREREAIALKPSLSILRGQ